MSSVVTCAHCHEDVLEADRIGDEEECALRDHLLAAHAKTVQPGTLGVLLKHLVVTDPQPKRNKFKLALRDPVWVGPWAGGAATPLEARLLTAPYQLFFRQFEQLASQGQFGYLPRPQALYH